MNKELEFELGFVISAFFTECVHIEEIQMWVDHKIRTEDDLPHFFYDLVGIKNIDDIYECAAISPDNGLSESEMKCLDGIAYLRGVVPYERPDKAVSLEAVKEHDSVLKRFEKTFPFITLK